MKIKAVAVISESKEDFENYMNLLVGDNYNKQTSRYSRFIDTDKFRYYRISKVIHCCSITVKDILITENAYKNDEIIEIIRVIKPTLYPLSLKKSNEIKKNFEILINKHNNE